MEINSNGLYDIATIAMPHEDLPYRFRTTCSVSSVSKAFHRWIDVMSRELRHVIC